MKKLLYTFFFGYAAFRYRRLIRTLIILTATICFIGIVIESIKDFEVYKSKNFYESPNGNVYTEGDLAKRYGLERFNQLIDEGQLKKKDSPQEVSNFRNGTTYYYNNPIITNLFLASLGILIGLIIIGLISFVLEPFVTKKNNEILEIKTKVASISDEITEVTQGSKSSSSSNGIRKFKFFLIYFVVFWIQAALVVVISFTIIGPRPSGLIAFGSLLSFWTSYKITKAIMSKYLKP